MPQFILVELPTFRLKTLTGQPIALSPKHLALFSSLYQFVRSGLATTTEYNTELSASLLFAGGEPDTWTSSSTASPAGTVGFHAEENLLLTYFHSFDAPGAYPIVDALLMNNKPCANCMGYFGTGKTLRSASLGASTSSSSSSSSRSSGGNGTTSFRARFTPRSDRSYTPIFYISRSLDAESKAGFWLEMATMWSSSLLGAVLSSPDMARGQMYYLVQGSAWFAVNEQEGMTDGEILEVVVQQGGSMAYWVGR